MDNNGLLTEAFSYDNNSVIGAGKTIDTKLIFSYSDQSNADISFMTLYIGNEKTRVHLTESDGEKNQTSTLSDASWAEEYTQFYGMTYEKPLSIEITDDEAITVITSTPKGTNLICWFDLDPYQTDSDGRMYYAAQMSEKGDTLNLNSDYILSYNPNGHVVMLNSDKDQFTEFFTLQ